MRYLVRTAAQKYESFATAADVTLVGYTYANYLASKYSDFCRLYAEAKLKAADGP